MVEARSRSSTTFQLGIFELQIAADIAKIRHRPQSLFEQRGISIKLRRIRALQGKLIETSAEPPADADDRRVLQRNADARARAPT